MVEKLFLAMRPDGWPLCPQCGKNELWSPLYWDLVSAAPTMEDYRKAGLICYACHWQNKDYFTERATR